MQVTSLHARLGEEAASKKPTPQSPFGTGHAGQTWLAARAGEVMHKIVFLGGLLGFIRACLGLLGLIGVY